MRILYPSVFTGFSCLMGECPLTCCVGWSIDIDPESLARYRALGGEAGRKILQRLRKVEDSYSFAITDQGRCIFLDRDGMCGMQKEMGAEMLCETCRFFPRLSWNAGSYLQFSMDLACPEVCRMAFTRPLSYLQEEAEGTMPLAREGRKDLEVVLARRKKLMELLERSEVVGRIVTDGSEDDRLAHIVADCTKASRIGFLTPSRVRHLHRKSDAFWAQHQDQLVPWFSTLGSLLLFRYGFMAWYGASWGKTVRFVRRAMRLTYLILLHQDLAVERLDVDCMVAASLMFARRIEHVEKNLQLLITG